MTATCMPRIELISRESEELYVTLIENYGLSFALPFLKVIDSVSYLTIDEKIDASKIYLSNIGRIVEQNFVHCDGHSIDVESGYDERMGFFIEMKCWECDGFDYHGTKSLGNNSNGKPVNRVKRNWNTRIKRRDVTF